MACSVDDLAFLLQAMAGHDPNDRGSADVAIPDYVEGIARPGAAVRVGIPKEHFFDALDPDVRDAFEESIRSLKRLGASIHEVGLPHLRYALGAELAILSAEASSYHRPTMLRQPEDVSPNVRRELDAGMTVLATDYILGQRVRCIIADEFAAAFNHVDVLATPTIPIPPPRIDQAEVEINGRKMSTLDAIWRNSYPTNLTGSPTLCLPNGFTRSDLPTSLQLIGKNFDEMTLLRVGRRLQEETDWHKRAPALMSPPKSNGVKSRRRVKGSGTELG
jgi:aspartyl-tRNA(Asn)/glutamyl-tRNA(Gln) amidotransferase subunit A